MNADADAADLPLRKRASDFDGMFEAVNAGGDAVDEIDPPPPRGPG